MEKANNKGHFTADERRWIRINADDGMSLN
jgi:hypothetical protein